MAEIKAIETIFRGHRFRSRLEARWAVFFDALGVEWLYEPEGYELDAGRYLPDFFLPGIGFVEIKAEEPTPHEVILAEQLACMTEQMVYIFFGPIPGDMQWGNESAYAAFPDMSVDTCHWWCECLECGKLGIQYTGAAARICRHTDSDRGHNEDSPRILAAYDKARMARFEHGDTP